MFRFSITAANSQIIGTSQNYKSESGRDNGIESVKEMLPGQRSKKLKNSFF